MLKSYTLLIKGMINLSAKEPFDFSKQQRRKKEKEYLKKELELLNAEMEHLSNDIQQKELYLKNFDLFFEAEELTLRLVDGLDFTFYLSKEKDIIAFKSHGLIESGAKSRSDEKYVSILDGEDLMWEYINAYFYHFILSLDYVLSKISLMDGKKLLDLMYIKYKRDLENIKWYEKLVNKQNDALKNGYKSQEYVLYINFTKHFITLSIDNLGNIIEYKETKSPFYFDKDQKEEIITSSVEDCEQMWKLIQGKIMFFEKELISLSCSICQEDMNKIIEMIKEYRRATKPKALLLEI